MPDHAVLSASSSHRWIACPPSAQLNAQHPSASTTYAQEGTDAHSLAAYKVMKALGRAAQDPTPDLSYFNAEMDKCTDAYRDFVMQQIKEAEAECRDPLIMVEQRLDFSRWAPDGFGTGDLCIVADGMIHVIDFKFGAGIPVSAVWNPQLLCYALGLMDTCEGIYPIDKVRMSIFQPRRESISQYEITAKELLTWAEKELVPAAKLAIRGEGEFRAGDHCQFCSEKANCRKRAEYNLEMARYDFAMPDTLTEEEIAAILPRIDELVSWAGDVKEFALQQALSGTEYPGYKVVAGRSNTRYTDENAVAAAVTAAGEDPYERKLLGVTAMRTMLGKTRFNEILGGLIAKPSGKPTLVPLSDKRPAINNAKNEFMMEENENE